MPGGRPKGTGGTRKRLLLAFSQKYDEKLDSYREKWQPLKSFGSLDAYLKLMSNPEFQRDLADSLKTPVLCFGEVLQETRLSRPTVAERLRELVSEGLFTRCREGKRQVYAPRSLDWLLDECGPLIIAKNPRGRPRGFPNEEVPAFIEREDQENEDIRLLRGFLRLPPYEVKYLMREGVRAKQMSVKGGTVFSLAYRAKTEPDIREAIKKMSNQRHWENVVRREKAYVKSGSRLFSSYSKRKLGLRRMK